jgi:hypothetical protein
MIAAKGGISKQYEEFTIACGRDIGWCLRIDGILSEGPVEVKVPLA